MQQATKVESRQVPRTRAELEALQITRVELKSQLESVNQMKAGVLQQIVMAEPGPAMLNFRAGSTR